MDVKEYGARASSPPFESGQDGRAPGRAPEDVPPGYKRTEVGVIPEDWEWERLGVECDLVTKGTTPTSIERQFVTDGIRFLKAESISDEGKIIPEMIDFIDESTHRLLRRSQLQVDDLLVSIAGVLGKIGQVREGDSPANTNQALAIVRLKKRAHINRNFLFWYLRGENIQKQILDISVQGAQANISLQNVRDFQIVQPEEGEQLTIAETLSDTDALIESLQQLIAKQRAIKQGAMQALLAGRQRLPGFSGEWQTKRLADICSMKSGASITSERIDDHSLFPCYGGNGLRGYTHSYTHEGEYALIGRQGALCGNVMMVSGRFFASEHAIVVTPSAQTDIRWLARMLERMELNRLSESSAQPGLSVAKLYELECQMPQLEEQTAIANVLSDMDAEIEALEARLAKTRALKIGIMQALLTGRIRLV